MYALKTITPLIPTYYEGRFLVKNFKTLSSISDENYLL